jgi:hypothetical protein
MSWNECLFQGKGVCAFVLVCISSCTSVFASDYCLSSGHGFDSVASAAVESNSVNPSANADSCLSLLTLFQVTPTANQKETLHLNMADSCQTFCKTGILLAGKLKNSNTISDTSFVDGQGLTVTGNSPTFETLLPANALWTLGQYEILWSFTNSSADKIAAAQNVFADKWLLHAIRIADSTTSGILASGTSLLKHI